MKYPSTTWNPHERKSRLLERDYEDDTISAHLRLREIHAETSFAFITKNGLSFQDGSTNLANEAKHERGKAL